MTSKSDGHCAYCGDEIDSDDRGVFAIHRDGFDAGPEVPLCRGCGGHAEPTCDRIWARISRTTGAAGLHTKDLSLLDAAVHWQDDEGVEGVCPSKPGDDPRLRKMMRRGMVTLVTEEGRDVSGAREGDVPVFAITEHGRMVLAEERWTAP